MFWVVPSNLRMSPLAVVRRRPTWSAQFVYESKETLPNLGDDTLRIFWLFVVTCGSSDCADIKSRSLHSSWRYWLGCISLHSY